MSLEVPHFLERVKEMGRKKYTEHLIFKYNMEDTVTENDRISTVGGRDTNHHIYTWERIYHFSCGNCKNWWSYATIEDSYNWKSRKMTCPHCSHYSTIQPNSNIMEIDNAKIKETL